MTFQRENRYIVIKRKDLIAAAETGAVDASFAEALDIVQDSLPTRECLVIESDWPEYEPAWQMIQARMEGPTPPAAQVQGECNCPGFGKQSTASHAPNCPARKAQVHGEKPVVVGSAWLNIYNKGFDHVGPFPPTPGGPVVDEPLMTVRQHERIVAALQAEIRHHQLLEQDALEFRQELIKQRDEARAALSASPAADESEPAEALAARLIEVRAAVLGHAVPWAEAVKITATITKMPDEEKAALLAMDDAPPAAGVLEQMSEEARSTLVGMVEFCLERRYCMGMDEGFASFEPETEHGFVKELRAFVEGAPTPPASEQRQAVDMAGWISCNDRLPAAPDLWVLVFADGAYNCMAYADGKWQDWTEASMHNIRIEEITHWMPLPAAPSAGVNQGVTTEAGNGGGE